MFVLVVDDRRIFGDKHNDCIVHHTTSSVQALEFLKENFGLVSEMWLDYDLGGSDTVTPVIDWLDEKAYNGEANHITAIRILTDNPVGYNKIMLALDRHFFIGVTPKHKSIRGEPEKPEP